MLRILRILGPRMNEEEKLVQLLPIITATDRVVQKMAARIGTATASMLGTAVALTPNPTERIEANHDIDQLAEIEVALEIVTGFLIETGTFTGLVNEIGAVLAYDPIERGRTEVVRMTGISLATEKGAALGVEKIAINVHEVARQSARNDERIAGIGLAQLGLEPKEFDRVQPEVDPDPDQPLLVSLN